MPKLRIIFFLISGFIFLSACSSQSTQPFGQGQKATLQHTQQLFTEYYAFEQNQSVLLQNQQGLLVDHWDNLTPDSMQIRRNYYTELQQKLLAIAPTTLDLNTYFNWQSLQAELAFKLSLLAVSDYLFLTQRLGDWPNDAITTLVFHHDIQSIVDAHAYLNRLEQLPLLLAQWKFYRQQATGETQLSVYSQTLTPAPPDPALLFSDFSEKLQKLTMYPRTRKHLEQKASSIITRRLQPAYAALTSTTITTLTSPQYQVLAHYYSDNILSNAQLHDFALAEVSRIQTYLLGLLPALGNTNTEHSIDINMDWLRNFQQHAQHQSQPNSLAHEQVNAYLKQLNADLVDYFPSPKTPLAVAPKFRNAGAHSLVYIAPKPLLKRPGIVYLSPNTNPAHLFTQVAAIFGQHLLQASVRENPRLPDFMQSTYPSGFSEGWTLYVTQLAYEQQQTPSTALQYDYWQYELLQAAAMVVDTGLYLEGWSLDQARQYLIDNTPLTATTIEAQLNHILNYPAQALAAPVGRFAIQEQRQQLQAKLNNHFNLLKFHQALLAHGALPLTALNEWISIWASQQEQR